MKPTQMPVVKRLGARLSVRRFPSGGVIVVDDKAQRTIYAPEPDFSELTPASALREFRDYLEERVQDLQREEDEAYADLYRAKTALREEQELLSRVRNAQEKLQRESSK